MEVEESEVAEENEVLDDDELDPRIQIELEKLNKAADNINRLDIELEEARYAFRQSLKESTHKLDELAKKLGHCIERSRPYYEARLRVKEAQSESQEAAFRYEKACSAQAAAKEMVCLAEEAYMDRGEQFDTAWQEMLNHATMKENEAEKEMKECEIIHKLKMELYEEAERQVKELHREFKRAIHKSRPYFEMKAEVNHQLEERKNAVAMVESDVTVAKEIYKEALANLEKISNEIHTKRGTSCRREPSGGNIGEDKQEPRDADVCDSESNQAEEQKQSRISPERDAGRRKDTSVTSNKNSNNTTQKSPAEVATFRRGQKQRMSYLYAMRNSMADYDIGNIPKPKIDGKQRSISLFGLFLKRVSPPKDDLKEDSRRSSAPLDVLKRVSPPNDNATGTKTNQSVSTSHPASNQTNQPASLSHTKDTGHSVSPDSEGANHSAKYDDQNAISQTASNQIDNFVQKTERQKTQLSNHGELSDDSEKVCNIQPDLSGTGYEEDDTRFRQLPRRHSPERQLSEGTTILVQSTNGNPLVHVEAGSPEAAKNGASETVTPKTGADSASDTQTSQSDSGFHVCSDPLSGSSEVELISVQSKKGTSNGGSKPNDRSSYLSVPNSGKINQSLDQWSDTESVGSVCSYTLDDDAIEKCMINTSQIELEFEDIMAREERGLQELDEHYNSLPSTLSKLEMFFQKSPMLGKSDQEESDREDQENDCDSTLAQNDDSISPETEDTKI
ncbi:uncharacterized protein LOC106151290 isoform X2 [Lingula anatina]|uniref:Uncharacterized protein LOC106151290 isoform X2 n=1 Tax=Lingula anatina TaxID=7574 RepID=A0A1S3H459_LINAN|nr:uncharacterized protein LOC106151290 isoform X2 [Lingula anatina]|eukprot:XP_013379924.1 uncharacterized protein LOC106151290 isoform X2 [Lingula anatina]